MDQTSKKWTKHHEYIKSKKHCFFALLSILIIVVILSVSVDVYNKIKVDSENRITVSGTGKVYTKPDLALTSFSVITEAETVAQALSQNTEKMNQIISFIKGQGVEDKDLKTIDFNIYPRYEWEEQSKIPPYPAGKRVLVGYEVRQSLQVKIRELTKIGEIIQGAADSGANQVGSLQFTVDDQDELKSQAREKAIEQAKEKAEELASQLGIKLVRITNFSESGIVPRAYMLEESEAAIGAGAPEIEIGETKIEVTVTLTYEIK
jgi:hypothetical protein